MDVDCLTADIGIGAPTANGEKAQMSLPPFEERRSDVLAEQVKRLDKLADEIESVARDHRIPQLNPLAERVRDAVENIENELARRGAE